MSGGGSAAARSALNSATLFYAIQRDVRAALSSLHLTIHALLTRGQSLESLTLQSDALVNETIIFELHAESARQSLMAQQRFALMKRHALLFRISCCCTCLLLCVSVSLYYTAAVAQR